MNNGIVRPDRFIYQVWERWNKWNNNSRQTYSINGFSSIIDPTNVEQIIIHCNRTSISSRDAEWAACPPWIRAWVKNIHGRYFIASIVPSHSISAMRQASKFYVAAVSSHDKRDSIQSRESLTGLPPRQLPSGNLFWRSYLEAATRNLPLDHTFLLTCVLQFVQ